MTIRNLIPMAFVSVAMLSACSDDNDTPSAENQYVNSVEIGVDEFVSDAPSTRTAYSYDKKGIKFQWAEGDALGIYPIGGDQQKFPLTSGDASSSASFDGGAWKMRSEYTYAAYHPFSTANYTIPMTEIPVDYTGQAQNGNGSMAHLGKYDYLACPAIRPNEKGKINFQMQHLGSILRLQLSMPKADTYSEVVLSGKSFVTKGTFDLTASQPAIVATSSDSTYTIKLTNASTTAKNKELIVYAMVAPTNLDVMTIEVKSADGQRSYVKNGIKCKAIKAGKAYGITATLAERERYVDLGLPSGTLWATTNIGASQPWEYGLYFAWGDTKGYTSDTSDGHSFDWENYKWTKPGVAYADLVKYIFTDFYSATPDDKTILDPEDDAAIANWGSDWIMPTLEQLKELVDPEYTTREMIYLDGIHYGMKITSKKNKKKSIFLPAAGGRWDTNLSKKDVDGFYWSRSIAPYGDMIAGCLVFSSLDLVFPFLDNERYSGNTIRPVRAQKAKSKK